VGVFLAYASRHGHALIDRELYLPQSWAEDPGRRHVAGIPQDVEFTTKPRQAQAMISRAIAAGVPFAWFTADEAYGQAKYLQAWLEGQDVSYVMAIRCSDTLTMPGGEQRADALIAAAPSRAWQRLSTGAGAHGPREFDWTRIAVCTRPRPGRGHWLLARRSLSDPAEIAYYACYGPRRSSTADLAWIAGSRWHIEECFQQAKGEAGLDHYQVRSWRAWYAHITLSMLALAWLAASRAQAQKLGAGTSDPGMIGYTLPEIRRLLISLIQRYAPDPEAVWSWSRWRRRRQYQARLCHYRRYGYQLT
jgi:SRSO17 transposase